MSDERFFNEDFAYAQALETHATQSCILDDLEPLTEDDIYTTAYRAASKKFLFILNQALAYIKDSKDKTIACYQVGLVTESAICDGRSMEQIANGLGCTRAALSKGAKAFSRQSGLPPSSYMKKSSATPSYRKARIQSIHNANNKTKE